MAAGKKGMIVDAHLDIAWAGIGDGRAFVGAPTPGYAVTRDALRRAGVGLVFPTIFTMSPAGLRTIPGEKLLSRTPREAHLLALAQVGYYRAVNLRLITTARELRQYRKSWKKGDVGGVLLMESAEPIESPQQVGFWADQGVRVIGPAWMRTRYSGGTAQPGGLTDDGQRLLREMARHQLILDLAHLADRAMRDAFEAWRGPLVSTHSGARALNPGQRQLPDWALREIGARDGIAGISFYQGHLRTDGAASIQDIVDTALHFARISGDVRHVAIGSDLDGGFATDHAAIQDYAQMKDVRRALTHAFSPPDAAAIMGGNWLRFLEDALP